MRAAGELPRKLATDPGRCSGDQRAASVNFHLFVAVAVGVPRRKGSRFAADTAASTDFISRFVSRRQWPRGKSLEPQVADANTDKSFHFVTDLVKHAANLPVDALSQDNA